MTKPSQTVRDKDIGADELAKLAAPVEAFYAFWANGNPELLSKAVSPGFLDHTLPAGRPQGPTGPAQASRTFLAAIPDLRVQVLMRLIVADRVVSHLRFSGHFTGEFAGKKGAGQAIDFIATDIVAVRDGKITDNWHLEDNLTLLKQMQVLP